MIKVYFFSNNQQWDEVYLAEQLSALPADMQDKILAYKNWQDRQARVIGKQLLKELLTNFGIGLSMDDLKYDKFHKPHFNQPFYFSTAHSSDLVVCAASMASTVGVDLEKIVDLDIEDYKDQLCDKEWNFISDQSDPQNAFYEIWTKKEALLKALGRGIDIDFNEIDVCADSVKWEGKTYYFRSIYTKNNYVAHVASEEPNTIIELLEFRPSQHRHDK